LRDVDTETVRWSCNGDGDVIVLIQLSVVEDCLVSGQEFFLVFKVLFWTRMISMFIKDEHLVRGETSFQQQRQEYRALLHPNGEINGGSVGSRAELKV